MLHHCNARPTARGYHLAQGKSSVIARTACPKLPAKQELPERDPLLLDVIAAVFELVDDVEWLLSGVVD